MMTRKLILIDGMNILYRAYHANIKSNLRSPDGQPTGAIYGMLKTLNMLKKRYKNDVFVSVFDAKTKTFRHDLHKDYKSHRKPMPEELVLQLEPVKEIIDAYGSFVMVQEGIEADDVIAILARTYKEKGGKSVIVTSDKDIAQIVDNDIILFNPMQSEEIDVAGVVNKFKVQPEQIVDYLSLLGDASDNIKGVEGVGEKTASILIKYFGSLADIYQNLDKIETIKDKDDKKIRGAQKIINNLQKDKDNVYFAQSLIRLKLDATLSVSIDTMLEHKPNHHKLQQYYTKLGFTTMNAMPSKSLESEQVRDSGCDVSEALNFTICQFFILFDELIGLAVKDAKGFEYIDITPINHQDNDLLKHEYDEVITKLNNIFATNSIKVACNFKDYLTKLYAHNITPTNVFDPLIVYAICNQDAKYVIDATIDIKQVIGKKQSSGYVLPSDINVQRSNFVSNADLWQKYVLQETNNTYNLYVTALDLCRTASKRTLSLINDIEMPLQQVIAHMESIGTLIDIKKLNHLSSSLQQEITAIESNIYSLVGETFNLSSPKQVANILYKKLNLHTYLPKTKKELSTNEETLIKISELSNNEVPNLLLKHRGLLKLVNTYTDKLPKLVDSSDRIHTHYNQLGTVTGRLSSNSPNLQNIPARSSIGKEIRRAFVAEDGKVVLCADYSQIELRIMAHISGDIFLINAFHSNVDVHKATAAEIFNVGIEQVTDEQRQKAKAINFGLIYGMSRFGLAKQIHITDIQAAQYIDAYFARYPSVATYMQNIKATASKDGCVVTELGRIIPIYGINDNKFKATAQRQAINAPIQGLASDIIKLSMLECHKWCLQQNFSINMLMQVHDELVFTVDENHVHDALEEIAQIMQNIFKLKVPLIVDTAFASNWGDAH